MRLAWPGVHCAYRVSVPFAVHLAPGAYLAPLPSGLVAQPANVYPSIVQPFWPMVGVSPVWPSQLGVPWPPVVLPAGGFGL